MKVVTATTGELGGLIEEFKEFGDTNASVILATPVEYRPVSIKIKF